MYTIKPNAYGSTQVDHYALTLNKVFYISCINFSITVNLSGFRRYIDQGRNPQLYTKECLERALARNEQVKGKIDTMTVRRRLKILASDNLLLHGPSWHQMRLNFALWHVN